MSTLFLILSLACFITSMIMAAQRGWAIATYFVLAAMFIHQISGALVVLR